MTADASAHAALAASIAGRELIPSRRIHGMLAADDPTGVRRRLLRLRQRGREVAGSLASKVLPTVERLGRTRVECPVCGWTGAAFRPFVGPGYVNRNEMCPSCGAASRHRLFATAWRHWSRLPGGGRCVYVAPEACLREVIALGRAVVTTDIDRTDVDVIADLEHLPLGAASAELVVCSDVLEHVTDDRAALAEIHRVLHPDGVALVHVPVMVDATVDYGRTIDIDYGHVRAYGPDVIDRFHAAGFGVDVFGTAALDASTAARAGLARDAVFALTHAVR